LIPRNVEKEHWIAMWTWGFLCSKAEYNLLDLLLSERRLDVAQKPDSMRV